MTTKKQRKLVSFDWALKRLLRSKANFGILEGFLSVLLREDIQIMEILESESNQDQKKDKFNRVDLKVKNQRDEIIIIELQVNDEYDYFQRILYGTSKAITEHMKLGHPYAEVKKVYSINIIYFDIGQGDDYVYHGTTHFIGLHTQTDLQLSPRQKKEFCKAQVRDLFPEYYILKINQFDDLAKDSLDEWLFFFKHQEIKPEFTAKGLQEAADKLNVLKLSDAERARYEAYEEERHYLASMALTYKIDLKDAEEKGIEKGMEKGKAEDALNMLKDGLPIEKVQAYTGLPLEKIQELLQKITH
jgi:predicted transposase/invertase (TIGR01784 family)